MPTITIQGTIIEIPASGASPNWAPAIIQAFQAIEGALSQVAGTFDVPPQVMTIDAYNPGVNIDMPNFSFPVSDVRAAQLIYSVYRTTTTQTVVETGTMEIVYNPNGSVGNKWTLTREGNNDAKIEFNVTDLGQVQFTTTTLSGSNHEGRLTYLAKALLQD